MAGEGFLYLIWVQQQMAIASTLKWMQAILNGCDKINAGKNISELVVRQEHVPKRIGFFNKHNFKEYPTATIEYDKDTNVITNSWRINVSEL